MPGSRLGWDCSSCDHSVLRGGSRWKGDGSRGTTGLLPSSDPASRGGEEHSVCAGFCWFLRGFHSLSPPHRAGVASVLFTVVLRVCTWQA